MRLREMDDHVTYQQQLQNDDGPVVLINQFNVAREDTAGFLEAWADDAAYLKLQPGFISTQLHQGTAGSTTYINVAVWESRSDKRSAHRSSRPALPATPTAPPPHRTSSPRSPSPASASPNGPNHLRRHSGRRAAVLLIRRSLCSRLFAGENTGKFLLEIDDF